MSHSNKLSTLKGDIMGTLEFVLSWAEVQVDWRPLMRLMSEIGVVRDFPGGPVIKTPHCQCRELGFHP